MKTLTFISFIAASLLVSGCNSGSSTVAAVSAADSGTEITVERGPIIYATVVDANAQHAEEIGNGRYRFKTSPAYPVKSSGGYIDINHNNMVDAGDIDTNGLTLQSKTGSVATIVSSMAQEPELHNFLKSFGLSDEEIFNATSSTNKTVAALSDEVYKYCIENGITEPSRLTLAQMEQIQEKLQNRIEAYKASDESAETLEQELVENELTIETISEVEAEEIEQTVQDNAAAEGLTDAQKYTLAYMWNEEKLAKDIYLALNEDFPANVLYNIPTNSETKHQQAVEDLIQKYDINITNLVDYTEAYSEAELRAFEPGRYGIQAIQDLYDALYLKGSQSLQDAYEVGCMVEVTDINDLDEDIEIAEGVEDLTATFNFLRDGSYTHYWAFDGALKNMGISDGCCALGDEYCKTAADYPQNSTGNGGGNGKRN